MTELPAELSEAVATVREALTFDAGTIVERRHTRGHAAIALVEQHLSEYLAELNIDGGIGKSWKTTALLNYDLAKAAERERDVARLELEAFKAQRVHDMAQLSRYEKALQTIVRGKYDENQMTWNAHTWSRGIARAALGKEALI